MKKKIKKPRIPRTRNAGTMTNAMFFQWLRQIIRRASIHWKPVAQARKDAQVVYNGPNKKRKYSYVCADCGREFAAQDISVHHKVECGTLLSFDDLPTFVERMFVEKEGLIVLCDKCHEKRHEKK